MSSLDPRQKQQFNRLHDRLLKLHKVLLDEERRSYEVVHGPVASAGQLLNLVMYDPWFDWLHRISETVVKIDELMDDEDSTMDDGLKLFSEIRELFQASADPEKSQDSPFMKKYKSMLQRQPAAVIAHAELQSALRPDA